MLSLENCQPQACDDIPATMIQEIGRQLTVLTMPSGCSDRQVRTWLESCPHLIALRVRKLVAQDSAPLDLHQLTPQLERLEVSGDARNFINTPSQFRSLIETYATTRSATPPRHEVSTSDGIAMDQDSVIDGPAVSRMSRAPQSTSNATPSHGLKHPHVEALHAELNKYRDQLHRLSATRSALTVNKLDHLKHIASLLDTSGAQGITHDDYAERRYGKSGTTTLKLLRSIQPDMEDLIVDAALMSTTHLDKFITLARATVQAHRDQGHPRPLSPWDLRKIYDDQLLRQTWYRGLKLGIEQGSDVLQSGLAPRLGRVLEGYRVNDRGHERGIYARTLSPRGEDGTPALDEAFDKPMSQVIEHRVNKLTRSSGRQFPQRAFKDKTELMTQLPSWKDLSVAEQKHYKTPAAYANKQWLLFDSDYKAQKKRYGEQLENESMTQSVTQYPQVAQGFGGSDLLGGGTPGPTSRVFSYQAQLSPLDVLAPTDWVPAANMSAGVIVDNLPIQNSAALESIVMGTIFNDQITQMQAYSASELPDFEPLG